MQLSEALYREYLNRSGVAFTEEEARELLRLVDLRNLTSHTYDEQLAEEIFLELEKAIALMKKVLENLRQEIL